MKAPPIKIMSSGFEYYGYLPHYESLQFERKLWEVGSFKLQVNLDKAGADQLLPGRILVLDEYHAGIIVSIEDQLSEKGLTRAASGVQLKGIAEQRITVPGQISDQKYFGYDRFPSPEEPDAPAETVLKHYAQNHMVSPEQESRRFPRLVVAADQGRGPAMRWSSRFEPLVDVFKGIGEYARTGYDILPDLSGEAFVFDAIPERIRTAGSDRPVIFSAEFGNLRDIKYSNSRKSWVNAGYLGGSGEEENRLIQTVYEEGLPVTGWERHEGWFDCGNVELPEELAYEGRHKMSQKKRTESIDGTVLDTGPFRYLEDWDIGDRVTVQGKQLGITADLQITGVRETYEPGKLSLDVTFGERPKNILDAVRKVEVVR